MSYFDEALKRANARELIEHFLIEHFLYGEKSEVYSSENYENCLRHAYTECLDTVKKYDNRGEDSELFTAINKMVTEYEHIYIEIGIQAGFLFAKDTLKDNIQEESDDIRYKEMYISLFNDISKVVEELQDAQRKSEEIYISI